MTKEKQKSDEEPRKKRRKGPLMVGALAAAALGGALFLREGKPNEPQSIQDDTRDRVTRVIADAGVAKRMALAANRIIPTETTAADLARRGDTGAGKWVVNKILEDIKAVIDSPTYDDEVRAGIFKKYGVSEKEFYALMYARRLNEEKEAVNFSPDDTEDDYEYREQADKPWEDLLITLLRQVEESDPFHPLFLAQIGMTAQELKDFVQGAISYVETHGIFSHGIWQDSTKMVPRLREAYNL